MSKNKKLATPSIIEVPLLVTPEVIEMPLDNVQAPNPKEAEMEPQKMHLEPVTIEFEGEKVPAYTYTQAIMVIGCKYLQQVRKYVDEGKIRVVGKEQARGKVERVLLHAHDVESMRHVYHPRDDDDAHSYEVRLDGDGYKKFIKDFGRDAIVRDLTEYRRTHQRIYHARQKNKDKGKSNFEGSILDIGVPD